MSKGDLAFDHSSIRVRCCGMCLHVRGHRQENRFIEVCLIATCRTGVVSIAAKAAPTANSTAGAGKQAGPPRLEYDSDRKKWVVENQVRCLSLLLSSRSHKLLRRQFVWAHAHGCQFYLYGLRDWVILSLHPRYTTGYTKTVEFTARLPERSQWWFHDL